MAGKINRECKGFIFKKSPMREQYKSNSV